MSIKQVGYTSGNGAEVDANGNALVTLPQVTTTAGVETPASVGAARFFSENDPGTVTGTATLKSPETSLDWRLRVGSDAVWDDENFNYTAQNFIKHRYTSTTLTATWASGFLNTNGGSVTTTGTAVQVSTYRHFPIQGQGGLYCETAFALTNTPVTNWTLDVGMFTPAAAGTSLPTDGVYFRVNSSGVFGVRNNNGTETTTSVFSFTPTTNQVYNYCISITDHQVDFWIDDVLYGTIFRPDNAGAVVYAGSLPWAVRHHHTGTTSAVIQAKIANYAIATQDIDNNRLWATNKSGQGMMSIVNPSGGAAGLTANYANSAAPASATLSNTTAGYATLGGQFQFAAPAGAETDFALFAFLNTAPTTSITGRNLIIRGVWIETFNMGAASATTATLLQWALAVGSTAISLATTDGAATRLPKRIPLGVQSIAVGTPIGGQANKEIDINLDAPLVVEPGTYLHIILKMPVGTATASQIIRGVVGINGYWE